MEQRREAEDPGDRQARFLDRSRERRREVGHLGEQCAHADTRERQQPARRTRRREVGPQAADQKAEARDHRDQVGGYLDGREARDGQTGLDGPPAAIHDDCLRLPDADPQSGLVCLPVAGVDAVDPDDPVADLEAGSIRGAPLGNPDDHAVAVRPVTSVGFAAHLQRPQHLQ
jgi:hypothetical protein